MSRSAAAVVGSRSATTYGAGVAGDVAAHLAGHGVTVVSGAAYGIDVAAHRGALAARGPTLAVLACGVDRAYPAAHTTLLDYIAERGLVVSELPPGCSPTRLRFLSRNRVIAALAQGTVVVEAAVRSGALNTANWAARLNRVVMGVPGPVTSAPSGGRAPADPHPRRGTGHQRCGRARAAGPGQVLPRSRGTWSGDGARPPARAGPAGARGGPGQPGASADSIARTAGIAARDVAPALDRLRGVGLVERSGEVWRLLR